MCIFLKTKNRSDCKQLFNKILRINSTANTLLAYLTHTYFVTHKYNWVPESSICILYIKFNFIVFYFILFCKIVMARYETQCKLISCESEISDNKFVLFYEMIIKLSWFDIEAFTLFFFTLTSNWILSKWKESENDCVSWLY